VPEKRYGSINVWKVLCLILATKIAYLYLAGVLRCRPCPFQLRLTWSEAFRTVLLVDMFNPLLFVGVGAWYTTSCVVGDCERLYSQHMYFEMRQMVAAQFYYMVPFMLYLYLGMLLRGIYKAVTSCIECLVEGFS
jgi:hypothetical protein